MNRLLAIALLVSGCNRYMTPTEGKFIGGAVGVAFIVGVAALGAHSNTGPTSMPR